MTEASKALESIVGYHRIGNSLYHISLPGAIIGGVTLGSVYSWRLWEGCKAIHHDRKFPEEPKQLSSSWFIYQIGLEAAISTFVLPIATGIFRYRGPVPIPEDMKTTTYWQYFKSTTMNHSPTELQKDSPTLSTSLKSECKALKEIPWRTMFKFRF